MCPPLGWCELLVSCACPTGITCSALTHSPHSWPFLGPLWDDGLSFGGAWQVPSAVFAGQQSACVPAAWADGPYSVRLVGVSSGGGQRWWVWWEPGVVAAAPLARFFVCVVWCCGGQCSSLAEVLVGQPAPWVCAGSGCAGPDGVWLSACMPSQAVAAAGSIGRFKASRLQVLSCLSQLWFAGVGPCPSSVLQGVHRKVQAAVLQLTGFAPPVTNTNERTNALICAFSGS